MNKKDIVAIFLLIIVVSAFFLEADTITSGYQLVDDHEILRIKHDLASKSFLETTLKWIEKDLTIRYRPVYYVHRIVETKVFGSNLTLWSLYTILLFIGTMLSFYAGMRKMGFPILESVGFLLLTFIGPQMEIWWRLGPNETIGMFFLGLAFFFMLNCEKRYWLNTILFSFFLVLASLSKESFTIIIPAMLIFKIFHEKKKFSLPIKDVFKKNIILLIPLLVMVFNLYIIVFVVGTNQIGYAGVSGSALDIIKGGMNILTRSLKNYLLLSLAFLGVASFRMRKKNVLEFYRNISLPFWVLLFIVTPNLILYAESGMMAGRYLLPLVLGFSIFIVALIRETGKTLNGLRVIFLIIVFGFTAYLSAQAFKTAQAYSEKGIKVNAFLSAVLENSTESSEVLLVVDPLSYFEASIAVQSYISLDKNIPLYGYAVYNPDTWNDRGNLVIGGENLIDIWESWFDGKSFSDLTNNPDLIIFLERAPVEQFFNESGIDKKDYTKLFQAYGFFVFGIK